MASNSIKIYDDTVIKLSVNQGLENQRTAEILGNFTNGELAFTRDSGRLFVGDNSDGEAGHKGLQETIGGVLVGNKYLGLLDSKPLVAYQNNGTALSYESTTVYTGTQEQSGMQEPGLLTANSKFRLHSAEGADEKWDNWDRTAIYNPKYNAFNGDFMYDIYQNALVLFDTRISGEEKSETQPKIKMDETTGLPVSPETFVVNGKEVSSTSKDALNLTRRTKLINYVKENDNVTNSNMVYGDGYVILRMVEPDNQTIRFKTRAFQENGLPETDNNYTHNLLEVFHVPTSAILGCFSDDFVAESEIIYLNKDIAQVKSITGSGGSLKIPGNLCFSTAKQGGRGATTFMKWEIHEPNKIVVPGDTNKKYRLALKPTTQTTEDGKQYITFSGDLEEIVPCSYVINLEGGLYSDQSDPSALLIDKQATNADKKYCPTLRFVQPEPEDLIIDGNSDPYATGLESEDMWYTGNLGVDSKGRVRHIDEYTPTTHGIAKARIDTWEEQNTSVNYLKTPITIAQSSSSSTLFDTITKPTETTYSLNISTVSEKTDGTGFKGSIDTLVGYITAQNTGLVARYDSTKTTTSVQDKLTTTVQNNKTFTIPYIDIQGVGLVVAGTQINAKTYIDNIRVSGRVVGLTGYSGKAQVFCALVNNKQIIRLETLEERYSNFLFCLDMDVQEVIVNNTTYVVFGFMGDSTTNNNQVTVQIDEWNITKTDSLTDEGVLELSDIGINAVLDFNVSPYVYCARKIISSPHSGVLPVVTDNNYPLLNSAYFNNNFNTNKTYVKVWNDLFSVIGRNHYLNTQNPPVSEIITSAPRKFVTTKKAFKYCIGVDYDPETNKVKKSTNVELIGNSTTNEEAFSWWKYYNNSNTNVHYEPMDDFEQRGPGILADYGKEINYIKVGTTNILNSNGTPQHSDVKTSAEESYNNETYSTNKRVKQTIFLTSTLFDNIANTQIEYGNTKNGIASIYDLKRNKEYSYSYDFIIDEDEEAEEFVYSIILLNGTNGETKTEYKQIKDEYKNLKPISVDTKLSNVFTDQSTNSTTFGSAKYVVVAYGPKDETDAVQPERYETYQVLQNAAYLNGFVEPGKLTGAYILNGNSTTQSVTLDETVANEDRIYIPTTARSIILELTHVTTENNTIGVFYANQFEDLGHTFSGLPVKEYNNPSHFAANVIVNPSYTPPIADATYSSQNGSSKLKLGTTIASQENCGFHQYNETIEVNKKRIPSIYAPAAKEKVLMNSSTTETRVVEVPLQAIPGTDTRHFALRFANIRPSNADILNQVVVRVIGYRV